ncbi:D-alanyl-D-alanine carboxypeptidase / D-alanyl-D-alanine-endopeptidase (penicillin-binding protein 4) [Mycolicibacterium rutilum]|uniref:D-alanyl-D-alanine carboxypeptidase / D-alanyl-D-alanine-endopeptidase (Penicillin-binding protein 4) n=1 Tax=Mycolicibacterium rutilum TaxID=370526 RepID=A0A1H6JN44_MYCRU|nr:D-alanyl-D-alanine carboxypeptidase/D-alanyl-D-alanine-endopeptidase [Mycolicibacterium rutilum]SEH60723.1 D-alanyl-D-alanine carboxypeptidase / D-alanyl-D-alanine-endopeptidase (penicillin-binding protein 4) [Mycolicibacterium rutilum]
MRPTRWRRSTHVAVGVAVLLLVAVVVAVAAVLTTREAPDAAAIKPTPAAATANPAVVPVADSAPKPVAARLAAALAPALADPNLGDLTGRITDALTGAELWAQRAEVPMQPASTNKSLTTAAALLTLDRDARLTTRVLRGSRPGVVVLKGGGDPTLSAAPPGEDTWYRDAARISDLAEQVRGSGIEVTQVVVDVSAYSGPTMAPGWDPLDIDFGDIAPMESVMLDGGRTQPVSYDSVRSHTPALDAGRALAVALKVDPATVTVLPGAATGQEIAAVQSPPLISRLRDMMNASDNVMAEAIGREVAAQAGKPQSFDGAARAVLAALDDAGIDVTGARLLDSSGLSIDDRLTARTLDEVVQAAAGDEHPALRPLVDLLPIAGGSGTLSNRYLDTAAAGFLRAKTGSLTGTNSLSGIVTDESGRVLTFALISNNAGPTGRIALDNLAAVLRSCGCSA